MKKLLLMFLVVIMMMSFVTVAWADEGIDDKSLAKVEDRIERTNEKISDFVLKAVDEAEKKIEHYADKEKDKEKLEAEIDRIIENLIKQTNNFAEKAIEAGEKEGIVIECSIIEVVIGGRTVLIDPLRIRGY